MPPPETAATTTPPAPPRPSLAARMSKGMKGRPIQILLLLFVFAMVIFATWFMFYGTRTSFSNSRLPSNLDGCYDSRGNVYSVLDANGGSVDSSGSQCQAVLNLATSFGFAAPQTCTEVTNITNPADASSFMTAMFCDKNTVYSLSVQNPPTPLAQIPMPFLSLINLARVGFGGAIYGDSILSPLLTSLQIPRYFQILNVTGSASPTRILNGTIPPLPAVLASRTGYFYSFAATNQNLSGPIPSSYADSLAYFNVSNNPLLSGPLPSSINTNLTSNKNPQWTQTSVCRFQNTQLCIPDGWPYQPSCIRDMAFSLPMCATGAMQVTIDPKDPNVSDNNDWSGSGTWTQQFAIMSIMSVIFIMWMMVWIRRRRAMQAQVEAAAREDDYYSHVSPERRREDIELQLRRADDMNLPTYEPPAPGYVQEGGQSVQPTYSLRDETPPKGDKH
ncbi:hypothetical protein HDU98_000304 [Podochytrium sp. JEL0797]|nr:hypothetical protein HDU98_000304 [Podochytrium sp. JEL0797]